MMIRLMTLLALLVPMDALAQTYPSAETFKNFPPPVYEAAQKAEKTATFAESNLKIDTEFLVRKEGELREALKKDRRNILAVTFEQYVNACVMVTVDGAGLVMADSAVTLAYSSYLDDPRVDIKVFTQWLKEIIAFERKFPAVAGDDALIKEARARVLELLKK